MSDPTSESPFTRALLVKPTLFPPSTSARLKLTPPQAGALAGTTVDLTLYPLDTLKTRLQSAAGFLPSGGFRGIYAGVGSAVIGSAPSAALFFLSYEGVKSLASQQRLREQRLDRGGPTDTVWREPLEHMAAASVGEVAGCAVRVPTEVVKQRAQALQARSSWEALRQILARRKEVGGTLKVCKELYRGWSITVAREVPFTIVQFPLWEALKAWRRRTTGREGIAGWESGLAGSVSGAVAAGATTPLDVLKTRLMLSREKVGARVMLRRILRENGVGAFFKGIGPRVLWIGAGGWVFLGTYQWGMNVLGKQDYD